MRFATRTMTDPETGETKTTFELNRDTYLIVFRTTHIHPTSVDGEYVVWRRHPLPIHRASCYNTFVDDAKALFVRYTKQREENATKGDRVDDTDISDAVWDTLNPIASRSQDKSSDFRGNPKCYHCLEGEPCERSKQSYAFFFQSDHWILSMLLYDDDRPRIMREPSPPIGNPSSPMNDWTTNLALAPVDTVETDQPQLISEWLNGPKRFTRWPELCEEVHAIKTNPGFSYRFSDGYAVTPERSRGKTLTYNNLIVDSRESVRTHHHPHLSSWYTCV